MLALFFMPESAHCPQWALSAFNLCATGQHRIIPPATQLNSPKAHEARGSVVSHGGMGTGTKSNESRVRIPHGARHG